MLHEEGLGCVERERSASSAVRLCGFSAKASATATASPLPTTGGPPLVGPLTWVATLTLIASGVGAVVLLRGGGAVS